jgi:BlaI family transcriptional regulator, penicillinase repressor
MKSPKISKQEWPIMEALWRWEALSIREIQTGICGPDGRPAYSTVQTMVYRLEARGAVRRVEKIRNYHVFEACITRDTAEGHIVADYLRFFDGRVWPFLEHSIAMGRMTKEDLKSAERYLSDVAKWRNIRV